MSLIKAQNRTKFLADERAYLDELPMSEEQKRTVLARDLNRSIALGGNIYFLPKKYTAASMSGMSQQENAKMMLAGGRQRGRFHYWPVSMETMPQQEAPIKEFIDQRAPSGWYLPATCRYSPMTCLDC